jgi:hypothetical protein
MSQSSSIDDDDDDDSDSDKSSSCSDEEDYPALEPQHNHRKPDSGLVPILQHCLEIHYSKNEGPGMHNKKWDDEDKKFQALLSTLRDPSSSSSNTIELGDVRFAEYRGCAKATAYNPYSQNASNMWLLIVPSLVIDGDSHGLGSSSSSDLLLACRTLPGFGVWTSICRSFFKIGSLISR